MIYYLKRCFYLRLFVLATYKHMENDIWGDQISNHRSYFYISFVFFLQVEPKMPSL